VFLVDDVVVQKGLLVYQLDGDGAGYRDTRIDAGGDGGQQRQCGA
jgi:hypothetical protein